LIRVGTRGSKLALAQTGMVIDALRAANPDKEFELAVISTRGDANSAAPVASLGVGVFVKELEAALSAGRVDMAVHSAKDMPVETPPGFKIAAVLKREDARDALVSRHASGLAGLPEGAGVATGSPRRRALLLATRPDLHIEPIRGNVDTRLAKLRAPDGPDALVLAVAGLARLGRLSEISEALDPAEFVPAAGQGALAVETLDSDSEAVRAAMSVQHYPTRLAVEAERAFLRVAGGGCSAPLAAHAMVTRRQLVLSAFASDPDGKRVFRHVAEGATAQAADIGERAARAILAKGAAAVLPRAGDDQSEWRADGDD
jgi:hydroxymethylbilane synthase